MKSYLLLALLFVSASLTGCGGTPTHEVAPPSADGKDTPATDAMQKEAETAGKKTR